MSAITPKADIRRLRCWLQCLHYAIRGRFTDDDVADVVQLACTGLVREPAA